MSGSGPNAEENGRDTLLQELYREVKQLRVETHQAIQKIDSLNGKVTAIIRKLNGPLKTPPEEDAEAVSPKKRRRLVYTPAMLHKREEEDA